MVQAVRDDLPQILIRVDAGTVLVDVGDLDGLAHLELARSQRLQAHNRLEQRGLTDAVGADYAHDAVARQGKRKVVDEHAAVELLVQVMGLQDLVTQTRTDGDADVGPVELLACAGLGLHLLVAGQTSLVLCLTGLRRAAYPLELGLHALGELGIAVTLRLDTRGLGLKIRGVVALVGIEVAAVDLADPLGNVIQEVTVVRDGQDGALVVVQEVLEPQDRLGVQVVRGLIEQQQIGGLEQQLAQGYATALAARKHVDRHIGIGQLQGVHGLAELGIDIPAIGGVNLVLELAHLGHEGVHVTVRVAHLLADLIEAIDLGDHIAKCHAHVLDNGLVVVERRLLLQDAHGIAGGKSSVAVGDLLDAGHNLEQGRLAHAVGAHDADLGAGIEAQGHVVKDHLVAMGLTSLIHLVDELRHSHFSLSSCGKTSDPPFRKRQGDKSARSNKKGHGCPHPLILPGKSPLEHILTCVR